MPALRLANFFRTRGYLDDIGGYAMSGADLATARIALKADIDCFLVNGLISLASATTSIRKLGYSWTFIQNYYSVFYFARAFNGINDFATVYSASKPYGIKIQPGEKFVKLRGNSHEVVLTQFKNHLSGDVLLANNIETKSPVDWFNEHRNAINYTLNPQTDPIPPFELFQYKGEFRKWISTYLGDSGHSYTFDPSHCYFSYPLQLFLRLYNYYVDNGLLIDILDEQTVVFLSHNFSDDRGPISSMMTRIQELTPR